MPAKRSLHSLEITKMTKFKNTQKTYVFSAPFKLTGFDHSFPIGQYSVEITEEMIEGLSFVAYKRIATTMRIIHSPDTFFQAKIFNKIFNIDPRDFDLAILKDRHQCSENSATRHDTVELSQFDQIAISVSENEGMTDRAYRT